MCVKKALQRRYLFTVVHGMLSKTQGQSAGMRKFAKLRMQTKNLIKKPSTTLQRYLQVGVCAVNMFAISYLDATTTLSKAREKSHSQSESKALEESNGTNGTIPSLVMFVSYPH